MYRPRATIHESAQVETIERRGRELFVQDQLAWHGTDLLAARQSTRELSKTGGFVAVPGTDNGGTLYFFGRDRAADEVRWVVEFSAGGQGTLRLGNQGIPFPDLPGPDPRRHPRSRVAHR